MTGRLVNVRPKPGFVMDGGGDIVRAAPNVLPFQAMAVRQMMGDRLSNAMSGMGTTVDRRVYGGYNFVTVQPAQVEAAYRTDWLMRKIVDIPAIDMTRCWRAWQAERDLIENLEKAERRFGIKDKVKRALVLARLWGGGALVIGVKGASDPSKELKPESVRKDDLLYVHVFAKSELQPGEMITDPVSPWYGYPEFFRLTPRNGKPVAIHPSRVIAFVGQKAPEGSVLQVDWFWGDPLYQSLETVVKNATTAQDGFAALIDEAKIDIIKIPDLMSQWASDEYEDRLMARLAAANAGKSSWRALILDGAEEWDQRQVTWTGMPDMLIGYLQMVAGAADIPITRLLGQSPKGLQSSGDGEEKDYHAMIEARQDELLTPALDRLDEIMIRSELGNRPEEIWWRYVPLMRLSPKEASEIEERRAKTVETYSRTGLFSDEALTEIAKNAITESGQWPGSDAAFEDNPDADDDDDDLSENELMLPEEIEAADLLRRKPRRIMEDARPRSLYVSRKLINADEVIRWAKAQGFKTTQPADAMHVTIAFSRKPVDWMSIGDDWSSDEDGRLRVKPGGPRTVEPLGDKGAVVLMFRNDSLEYRHRRIHEEGTGAQWDWPEYQPHVTLTWEGGDLDLDKVEPYTGPLVFGPEIFAEVVEDWEKTITEK